MHLGADIVKSKLLYLILKPIFEEVAKDLSKVFIKTGAVDCDNKENQQLCGSFGIKGYPTIKLFPSSIKLKNNQKKYPLDYNGQRDRKSFIEYAKSYLPAKLIKVIKKNETEKSVTINSFLKNNSPKFILFTDKTSIPPLYKGLAAEFHKKIEFGIITNKEKEYVDKYSINKFPTLLYFSNQEHQKYTDELKASSIKKFIQKELLISNYNEKMQEIKINEIKKQPDLEETCMRGFTKCVLAVIDDDKSTKNEQILKMLSFIQKEFKKINFGWINKNLQTKFIKQFEINSVQETLPEIVVIVDNKKRYYKYSEYTNSGLIQNISSIIQFINSIESNINKKDNKYRFYPGLRKAEKKKKTKEKKEQNDPDDEL